MARSLLWFLVAMGCVVTFFFIESMNGFAALKQAVNDVARRIQPAATFFVPSISTAEVQKTYKRASRDGREQPVKILLVPGHDPDMGGTEFGGVAERDLVVDIADSIAQYLNNESGYEIMIARSKTRWTPELDTYFSANADAIDAFAASQTQLMQKYVQTGAVSTPTTKVYHNKANPRATRELYGINKWASEHAYDIVIHLHINDDPDRRADRAGLYRGFAVYVPHHEYSNADASKDFGYVLAGALNKNHATSTLPKEEQGIVEDQDLIAIGSKNTLDSIGILIEYGYIYEPQFQNAVLRKGALDEYAYATARAITDYVGGGAAVIEAPRAAN